MFLSEYLNKRYYSGKNCLVLGGSEGIGLATAELLLKYSNSVTIASRNKEKLDNAYERLLPNRLGEHSSKLDWFTVDITNDRSIESSFSGYIQKNGIPDLVFIFPGVTISDYFLSLTIDDHKEMLDLNYMGHVRVIKYFTPFFLERGSGSFIASASMLGYIGFFGFSGYSASKHAVMGLVKSLHSEFCDFGLKFHCVCSPACQTPGLENENVRKPRLVSLSEQQAGILSPSYVARTIIKGVRLKKFIILPGVRNYTIELVSRFVPSLVRHLTRNVKKARNKYEV